MDITSDYGSLVRGSNPRGRAISKSPASRITPIAGDSHFGKTLCVPAAIFGNFFLSKREARG